VHLLNDERGWVLEAIVARLFRTVERTQRRVRLVGLSATLPNYLDVADFLRVKRDLGLFHFDASFRPVPLVIHFVGIKNPKDCNNNMSRSRNSRVVYNEKCYEMVLSNLRCDKQVLVFVHSRR
jgi:replicative superfamily II helicase